MRTRSASRRVKIDSSSGTDVAALFTWLANNIGRGRYSDHTAYGTHGSRCANGFDWLGHLLDSRPLRSCPWQRYAELASRIRTALGWGVLDLDHVGSTSVSGLVAKSIIDTNLTVADPKEESACVPALEAVALRLRVREPWWYARAEVA